MKKQCRQDLGLCCYLLARYPKKCFTQVSPGYSQSDGSIKSTSRLPGILTQCKMKTLNCSSLRSAVHDLPS